MTSFVLAVTYTNSGRLRASTKFLAAPLYQIPPVVVPPARSAGVLFVRRSLKVAVIPPVPPLEAERSITLDARIRYVPAAAMVRFGRVVPNVISAGVTVRV